MALKWPPKDPDEVLDYDVEWEARLAGDTIQTSTWVMPSGPVGTLEQVNDSFTDDVATIWFAAGVLGATYSVLNRIVTAGGRSKGKWSRCPLRW